MSSIKLRAYLLVLITGVLVTFSFGQQVAQYSNFMLNPLLYNPAYAGSEEMMDFKSSWRSQWMGIDGGPTTMYMSGHTPMGKQNVTMTHPGDYHNWHGVGGILYQDKIGDTRVVSALGTYAYNLKVTNGGGFGHLHKDGIRLSLGTTIGYSQFRFDGSNVQTYNSLTTGGAVSDAKLLSIESSSLMDLSMGMLFHFREIFYFGISSRQLLGNGVYIKNFGQGSDDVFSRHYYITGAYKLQYAKWWYVWPSFVVKKVVGAPLSVELNGRLDYHDIAFIGLSYRNGDALSYSIGTLISLKHQGHGRKKGKATHGLEIFYTYDQTISELAIVSKGAHEVTLGLRFPVFYRDRIAEDTW